MLRCKQVETDDGFRDWPFCSGECLKVSVSSSVASDCDPIDCSPPGFSVHGILQAGVPEWVAMPSYRGSSRRRAETEVSCVADRLLTT